MHEGMGDPRARTEERRQKPAAVHSDHNNNHLRPPPPPPQEPQQCPRCDSFNTKFCYYNNYSLSQPRFFCKACRRYWTRGGTLRNVPVGGGCRKGKRTKIAPSSSSSTTSSSATTAEPSSSLLQTQTQTLPLLHRQHEKLQSFASPAISPNLGISLPPTAALRLPGNNLISPPNSYVGGGGGSGGLLSSLSSWIHHHPTSSLNQHHVPASSFNQNLNSDFGGGGEGGSPCTNFSPYNLGLSQLQGYDLSAYGQQIHHRVQQQQQQQQRQHQQFQEVEYFHHQVGNSKDNIKNNLDQQPPTMCPLDQGGLMNSSQSSRLTDWNRSFNPANNANLNPTTPSDGGGFWNITTVGNSDAGAAGSSLNQTHWTDLP